MLLAPEIAGVGGKVDLDQGPFGLAKGGQIVVGRQGLAKRAVLGTWRLETELTGRDDVDRPLSVGQVAWNIEVREITPVSSDVEDTRYEWWGVLQAQDLCLVDLENFHREGGECTTLDPVDLGSCRHP